MLPQLRQLAARYPRLQIIGVHAGKYPNERRAAQLQAALERLGVEHPVLNDRKFRTWRAYGIFGWPTLVLLDPRGRIVHTRVGESDAAYWATLLDGMMADAADRSADPPAIRLQRAVPNAARHVLRYPEKLAALPGEQLAIADTGNHRIVVGRLVGTVFSVTKIIGSGHAGADDGPAETATFNEPRGLAVSGSTLFIADTANHRVRACDLERGVVTTVAGTGRRGTLPAKPGAGRETALASPWDLTLHAGQLVIAMAGLHQLWRYDPASGVVAPLAGTGAEDLLDGPLETAALAQPSGVSSSGDALYFVDSESQAVRRATPGQAGTITTLVGTGLFEFADRDGSGDEVLMQHPQAVVAHGGLVYIADTYNHKVKVLDPATRTCRTLLGRRRIAGYADGPADAAAFDSPAGLAVAGDQLLIADTNNHCIRAADLRTGEVRTLGITGLPLEMLDDDRRA